MVPVSALELTPSYCSSLQPGLARTAYGQAADGALHVPLAQLGEERLFEIWPEIDGIFFGAMSIDEAGPLERTTCELYGRLIESARNAGHPYFVRMWNYVGSINQHDEGGERYQLFCAGRHDAFRSAGYAGAELPSASAVGMPGRGLVACFLAAKEPGRQIENPRQIAAYRYPPRYGPKSPSFSRATLWGDTLFVSGTSSIVGHATLHAGDVTAQLEETLRNLEAVISAAFPGRGLESVLAAKTYLRHAADYPLVAERLAGVFPANLCLQADICRSDLLIEIEAVAGQQAS